MPIHVSYLDDRSVLCIADEEKLAKTTCTNETGSQHFNQQKKGGGHSLIISEKKEDHIYGGGMFQLRLRCTWTSVSFFFLLFSLFFLDWHSDQLIMGHLNPIGPSGVGGLLIVTAIQGEMF